MAHSDRRRCRIQAVGALAVAALSSPACFLLQRAPAPSWVRLGTDAETTSSLDLRVERSSRELLLTWNPRSELVKNSTGATLTIIDGGHKDDADLDLATLQNGSLVYSPITAEVSFRLEVRDARRGARDTASVTFSAVTARPDSAPLVLRVERSGGQLLVAWTRECAIIQNATRATLTIVDGDHQENVELDLATLRGGSVIYSPITADVSFRLEVIDATRGTHDAAAIRYVGSGLPRPAATSPPDKPPAHVVD